MAARQGFLLIELMLALSLFMISVYAILAGQAAMVMMHTEIVARTSMIALLDNVVEEGKGAGLTGVRHNRVVDSWIVEITPYHNHRRNDKRLPLHSIAISRNGIKKHGNKVHCKIETVGWIYE